MANKEIISYKSLKQTSETEEIVISKSRFIGYAAPALTEEEAKNFIADVHKRHPDSSCICHAYICGLSGQVQKFEDGHEPVGGMPILEVLKMQKIIGAVCAVVRYFGGTKLGMGGLARAFSNSAAKAVNLASPSEYLLSEVYEISFDYTYQGKIEYALNNSDFKYGNIKYSEKVSMELTARYGDIDKVNELISSITSGSHEMKLLNKKYVCWDD